MKEFKVSISQHKHRVHLLDLVGGRYYQLLVVCDKSFVLGRHREMVSTPIVDSQSLTAIVSSCGEVDRVVG